MRGAEEQGGRGEITFSLFPFPFSQLLQEVYCFMQPAVSLIRGHSYEQQLLRASVEMLLDPLGGIAAFVKRGDRVLLKPNLLTAARPGKECTTECLCKTLSEDQGAL